MIFLSLIQWIEDSIADVYWTGAHPIHQFLHWLIDVLGG